MRGARQRRRSVVKLVTGANYGPGWPDCAVRARRRAGSAAKRLINEHPTPFFFSGDGRHFFSRQRRYAHRWIQRRVESPRLVAFGKEISASNSKIKLNRNQMMKNSSFLPAIVQRKKFLPQNHTTCHGPFSGAIDT